MNYQFIGHMVNWRFKKNAPGPWKFGYVSQGPGQNLLRMGNWNGDVCGGTVVDSSEIECRAYQR